MASKSADVRPKITLACVECNRRKADRTPEQARMHLRKQPVRPTWKPLYAQHRVSVGLSF